MSFRQLMILGAFLCTLGSIAQTNEDEELGSWYILSTNNRITDKLIINAQTQLRYFELASELQQFKIRVGATYNFSPSFGVTGGYSYFKNDPSYLSDTPDRFNEHRTYEDIHLRQAVGALKFLHRYRLEQRFLEGPVENDFQQWMRYQLKLVYPLNAQWSIDLYDEVFINLEEPLFAQNWLGTGVSYQFADAFKVRVGYQKIHFDGPDFDRLLIGLYWNTDFRGPADDNS